MYDKSGKLIDRREMLKIKFNSLLVEAALIRAAERKQKRFAKRAALPQPWLLNEMREHRVGVLRREARRTSLALGFVRGRTLEQMESQAHVRNPLTKADWEAVKAMVRKFGPAGMQIQQPEVSKPAEAVAA